MKTLTSSEIIHTPGQRKRGWSIYYPVKDLYAPFYGTDAQAAGEIVVRERMWRDDLITHPKFYARKAREMGFRSSKDLVALGKPQLLSDNGERVYVEGYDSP